MIKRIIGFATFLILILGFYSYSYSKIIIARIDYPTIDECVSASVAGDIIYVLPGKYEETFALIDGVRLIGTSTKNTIFGCEEIYPVIWAANNTVISDLKIKNGWLALDYLNNVEVNGNIIEGDTAGYTSNCSNNIVIKNNIIKKGEFRHGINGDHSKIFILNNIIFGFLQGICMGDSDLYIAYNTVTHNAHLGIHDNYGHNSVQMVNNIVSENGTGIYIHAPSELTLDFNNVWEGDPPKHDLYYDKYYQCLVEPGPNSISVDPKFVDPENGDFHLKETSPCLTASSEGGEIGAYGNGGTPGVGIKLPLLQQIEIILRVMDYLPEDNFEKPNQKKILISLFKVIESNIQGAENEDENKGLYESSLDIAKYAILPRTDGCEILGYPDNNDWVTECKAQEWIYSLLLNLIETIEKELQ